MPVFNRQIRNRAVKRSTAALFAASLAFPSIAHAQEHGSIGLMKQDIARGGASASDDSADDGSGEIFERIAREFVKTCIETRCLSPAPQRAPAPAAPRAPQELVDRGSYQVTPPGYQLNVRSGPGTEYEVVGTMPAYTRGVAVRGCEPNPMSGDAWCQVTYAGGTGWASAAFLEAE